MEELLNWMEYIEDVRQARKVRHKLKDILVIVLFATLANADDWVEMELLAKGYQDFLRNYIELKNGIVGIIVIHFDGKLEDSLDAIEFLKEKGVGVEELGMEHE